MCLSKSYSPVDKKRVIYFSRRLCYRKGSRMGKVIISSHNKSVERIFRIQPGFLRQAFGTFSLVRLCRDILDFRQLAAVLWNKSYFVFNSCNFRDTYLQRKEILFFYVFYTGIHVYQYKNGIVNDVIDFQRLDPGCKRDIGKFMFNP